MRVFAKKTFEFSRRELKDGLMVVAEKATTIPLGFKDLPDWVEDDPLFGWARKDGDIEIIQDKADEKAAELKESTKGNKVKSEKVTGNGEVEPTGGNSPLNDTLKTREG